LSSYDNTFQPIRLTDGQIRALYNASDYSGMSFQQFKRSYKKLYNQLSILPLLQYEDDLNEEEKEVISILKRPERFTRQQRVEGGLVSGPEVSDTKENPADRVDPFTGAPYSDQMVRLGLAEGGEANIIQNRIFEIDDVLKELGYSTEARAAKLGNIGVETGYTYNFQQQQQNGKGYGLYQLDFQKPFYNKYLKDNKLKDSAANQLIFTHKVLQGNDKIMGINTKDRKDLQEAFKSNDVAFITKMFSDKYEKPGVPHLDRRIEEANKMYQLILERE